MRIAALNTKNMSPATICITMKPVKFSISSNFPTRPITFPHPHQHLTQAQRMWHWTSWQHIMAFFAQMWPRMLESKQKNRETGNASSNIFFWALCFWVPCLSSLPGMPLPSWSFLARWLFFFSQPGLCLPSWSFIAYRANHFFGSTHVLAYIFISFYFTTRNCLILDIMAWTCLTWWWVEGQCPRCYVFALWLLLRVVCWWQPAWQEKEIFHETS